MGAGQLSLAYGQDNRYAIGFPAQRGQVMEGRAVTHTIDVNTGRGQFTALVAGDPAAPVALLLHGFPDVPHTFNGLAAQLAAAGFRAVAPFARGYQPSPPFPRLEDGKWSVFETLGADAVAIAETLSPDRPVALVGHDNGAFTAYYALAQAPGRFSRAVTMTAGRPAAVFANTSKLPRQLWKSRYAFLFQVPGLSAWYARRAGFGYLRDLWGRWAAPGWQVPEAHWARVRGTMERSWPAPLLHYRRMAFGGPETPIATPLLYLLGDRDGCVEPASAEGQERYFADEFEARAIAGAGHFPHLERPEVVESAIIEWLKRTA